jgi:fluoroquinolone transport system ATP-binding protein
MIEVEVLNFRHLKQQTDTIQGINFQIAQGEIFGFLGPSGSGKSTTQKHHTEVTNRAVGKLQRPVGS